MDNSLDTTEEQSTHITPLVGQSVTERLEEALGKLLMKFKDLETRLGELDYRVDNLDSDVSDLRSDFDDFDSSRFEDIENDLEGLKETLRNV